MNAAHGDPGGRPTGLARRLLRGRRRYLVAALVVAIWLLVALIVGLATASGVVWF